jgi:serine/threonine protein kinase
MAALVSSNMMHLSDFYSNWAYVNQAAGPDFKPSRSLLHHCEAELSKRKSYSPEAVPSLKLSSPKSKRNKNSKSAPSPRSPKSTHKLHEQLLVLNKIEEGGYGSIYKGLLKSKTVAVKRVDNDVASPESTLAIRNEMRLLSEIAHPHIIKSYGGFDAAGVEPYIVMEFAENGNLHKALRTKQLSMKNKVSIALDIAKALLYLHSREDPIYHGDIKSLNVLLDRDLSAKLCDFGTARRRSDQNSGINGTVSWLAPEILLDAVINNDTTDVYSFGMLIYELLTDRTPYEGCPKFEVLGKICEGEHPVLLENLDADYELIELMRECTKRDPSERPSMRDVVLKLKKIHHKKK